MTFATTQIISSLSVIVVPTPVSPTSDHLDNSLCAAMGANVSMGGLGDPANMVINRTEVWTSVGGEEGWRSYWVIGGLVPNSNYTVWTTDGQGGLSGPIWLETKEGEQL